MTVSQLQDTLASGYPVIVLIQAWKDEDDPTPYALDEDDGHYVVAIGYDNEYFYFEDPWIIGSLAVMKKTELAERWHGIADRQNWRIEGCGIIVFGEFKAIPTVVYL
jgi:predicted double-glycine peptidase